VYPPGNNGSHGHRRLVWWVIGVAVVVVVALVVVFTVVLPSQQHNQAQNQPSKSVSTPTATSNGSIAPDFTATPTPVATPATTATTAPTPAAPVEDTSTPAGMVLSQNDYAMAFDTATKAIIAYTSCDQATLTAMQSPRLAEGMDPVICNPANATQVDVPPDAAGGTVDETPLRVTVILGTSAGAYQVLLDRATTTSPWQLGEVAPYGG